jgi:hypothetical protein
MGSKLEVVALHDPELREQVQALLAHFFRPLMPECPACGRASCESWAMVRRLAPITLAELDAISGAGVGPR